MFKIESYVTPILLSYVDKYVRDFKPANAQVSLWGGGVALHNLVLKEDVLQREVQLPFTLVSGRIHELLINVPWTKIMSEPITISIDTMECVLNVKHPDGNEAPEPPQSRKTQVVEAPPGYMQALVRRIVSNIAVKVHHLIVKYVHDDIVLSLNVKQLSVDSAGSQWEKSFADIDPNIPVIRRLVQFDDFTLCLDKSDADGKIRFYQEPLLYRCQLDFRVFTRLVSATTRRASVINIQLRSTKLALSVTSDQVLLLLRLVKEWPVTPTPATANRQTSAPATLQATMSSSQVVEVVRSSSWSEWAWSWLPSWSDRDSGADEVPATPTALPLYFSAYFDEITVVIKIVEIEAGTHRKRFRSIMELVTRYTAFRSIKCTPTIMHVRFGAKSVELLSVGKCVCGASSYEATIDRPTVYLKKTNETDSDTKWEWPAASLLCDEMGHHDSETANESFITSGTDMPMSSNGLRSQTLTDRVRMPGGVPEGSRGKMFSDTAGLSTDTLDDSDQLWKLMDPLIYFEFAHDRSPPFTYQNPFDNPPHEFEYSDWAEEFRFKVTLNPIDVRVCMGLTHRLMAIKSIMNEIPATPKAELQKRVLTIEECDALNDNLPQKRVSFDLKGLRVYIVPLNHTDHPAPSPILFCFELPAAFLSLTGPLYPNRVCAAACQMPIFTGPIATSCQLKLGLRANEVNFYICTPDKQQQKPCCRFSIRLVGHDMLNKQFFTKPETVKTSYLLKIRDVNVSGSSARLQAALLVIQTLFKETEKGYTALKYSSLPHDALNDEERVALDFEIDEIVGRGFHTDSVNTHIWTVTFAKATLYHKPASGDVKQTWLFSGPDCPITSPYLRIAYQWCDEATPTSFDYLGLWTEPTACSFDPLFISWLAYRPVFTSRPESMPSSLPARNFGSTQYLNRMRGKFSPPVSTMITTSDAERVHLRPRNSVTSSTELSEKKASPPREAPGEWWSGEKLVALHGRLRRVLIHVEMGLVLVYVTMSTVSALDCITVLDSMERHVRMGHHVLVFSLGHYTITTNAANQHLWHELKHDGPTFLTEDKKFKEDSFPWRICLADVSCYSLIISEHRMSTSHRSNIKSVSEKVQPRSILDLVTTNVVVTVVSKAAQIKSPSSPHIRRHSPTSNSQRPSTATIDQKTKFFTAGKHFKPSTLKEFFRGPGAKKEPSDAPSPTSIDRSKDEVPSSTSIEGGGPLTSLGINLHADTPPVIVRLQEDQLQVVAATLHCLNHLVKLLQQDTLTHPHRSMQTPTFTLNARDLPLRSDGEDLQYFSEGSKSSETIDILKPPEVLVKPVKTFLYCQWVVNSASVLLMSNSTKLSLDIADILGTADLQSVCTQFRVKVMSASIRYYERTGSREWVPGVLGGRVLEAKEASFGPREEEHFLSLTVTNAKFSELPKSWKQELHPKLLEDKKGEERMWEVYAILAPLEMIIQPVILENISSLVAELKPRAYCPLLRPTVKRPLRINWPHCYLNAGGFRLLVKGDERNQDYDDTFVLEIGSISMNPHPENPICRRLLNTPGDPWPSVASRSDGRQYEINIKNFEILSAQFTNIISEELSSFEVGSNTNPALKLSRDADEGSRASPILHAVDVCCVLAPAVYTDDVMTLGPAIDCNLTTDCIIDLNVRQILVWLDIVNELRVGFLNKENAYFGKQEQKLFTCPYAEIIPTHNQAMPFTYMTSSEGSSDQARSVGGDSGFDTITSTGRTRATETPSKKTVSYAYVPTSSTSYDCEYLELFFTMGTVEASLYLDDGDNNEPELSQAPQTVHDDDEPVLTASPESSDVRRKSFKRTEKNLPLLYLTLMQPNLYYWKNKGMRNIQVSLFNAGIGLGTAPSMAGVWRLNILSTGKGATDPVTGIPPALATLKIVAPVITSPFSPTSPGSVKLDVERPVEISLSEEKIKRLKMIYNVLSHNLFMELQTAALPRRVITPMPVPHLYYFRRKFLQIGIESVVVNTGQIGLTGHDGALGWDSVSFQLTVGSRLEKVNARLLLTAFVLTVGPPNDSRHVLLRPVFLGIQAEAVWEAWRRAEGGPGMRFPTVQICLEVDRVIIDLRPSDLLVFNETLHVVKDIVKTEDNQRVVKLRSNPSDRSQIILRKLQAQAEANRKQSFLFTETESTTQYYKDDLRSGAFKLTQGGQLPMAYQVTLHKNAVCWRYPHPRSITRIIIFPLPGADEELDCVLEVYTPVLNKWEPHTYFKVPVNEPRDLSLQVPTPEAVFAAMWRVRAYKSPEPPEQQFFFSFDKFKSKTEAVFVDKSTEQSEATESTNELAEQLSGILRVDSYFAPHLSPRVHVLLQIASTQLHLYNSLPLHSSMETSLEGYYVSRPLMRRHRVLSAGACNTKVHLLLASSAGTLAVFDSVLRADIIDSSTGTMEELMKEVRVQAGVSSKCVTLPMQDARVRIAAGLVQITLDVPRLRTLRSLINDWSAFNKPTQPHKGLVVPCRSAMKNQAVVIETAAALEGRVSLWVHNTSATALRIGQEGTDEVVPLGPGVTLAYRWNCPDSPKRIRLSFASPGANWQWSRSIPFTAGTMRVKLEEPAISEKTLNSRDANVHVFAKVVESGGKRTMTLSGRLMLANLLRHKFLYKVKVRCGQTGQWRTVSSSEVEPESFGKSVICNSDADLVLKIKHPFHDMGWSGDIPLKECPKENVPWLVKLPTGGTMSYVSVWCRVVRARSDGCILAMVWPLYVLYSHLPLDAEVLITTEQPPTQNIPSNTQETPVINSAKTDTKQPHTVLSTPGRGCSTHLTPPGTTAHKHTLSFQYRDIESPVTREAVPMHYGVTDVSVFDKRTPVVHIEEVLDDIHTWLKRCALDAVSGWPYSIVTKHWTDTWKSAVLQPRSEVTVEYGAVRAGGGCSLEVTVRPRVLLCNAVPLGFTLRSHDASPLCTIDPGTAVSPPSTILTKPFFLSIEITRDTFVSDPLQVTSIEPGRYGSLPPRHLAIDHAINFAIICNQKVALLTMHYEIKENINVFGITSTFTLTNRLDTEIMISAIAVSVERVGKLIPKNFKTVSPVREDSPNGISLSRFWLRDRWRGGDISELKLYLCVVLPYEEYPSTNAVPVRLGRAPFRRAFALIDHRNVSIPIVVTQARSDSRWLVTIAHDPCPQFFIDNRTPMNFYVAQPAPVDDNEELAQQNYFEKLEDCEHVEYWTLVRKESTLHYSTPSHCKRYPVTTAPLTPTNMRAPVVMLSFARIIEPGIEEWCAPVALTDGEQLVQYMTGVTIKLRVQTFPHSTLLVLNTTDEDDISARDIRRRLDGAISEQSAMITRLQSEMSELMTESRQSGMLVRIDERTSLQCVSQTSCDNTTDKATTSRVSSSHESGPTDESSHSLPEEEEANKTTDSEDNTSRTEHHGKSDTELLYKEVNKSFDSTYQFHGRSHGLGTEHSVTTLNIANSDMTVGPAPWEEECVRLVVLGLVVQLAGVATEPPLCALHMDRTSILLLDNPAKTVSIITVGDIQVDNLQYESGQFDFPVVASTRAVPLEEDPWPPLWNMFGENSIFISKFQESSLMLKLVHDKWEIRGVEHNELMEVEVRLGSVALYVEDAYVRALAALAQSAMGGESGLRGSNPAPVSAERAEERALRAPLRLRRLHLYPLDLTLTLHTAVRMYIALDQSPLRLGAFKLHDVMTSPDQLTHALTVHYLAATILGAGWVVGGLELLGAPGAIAARLGGATGGVKGVASATAAALLRSLSAWAGSLARNLDILAGDEDHARRAAAARRQLPPNFIAGLLAGFTNFAINILGAVGGLAHHPLVGVAVGETDSSVAALRRSLLGAVTKPLSATADLVAFAGHGLLCQTGWNPVPSPRSEWLALTSENPRGWRRDCVRWEFRLSQVNIFEGFEVLIDKSAFHLLVTDKYLVIVDPDSERILEMLDLKACSVLPIEGSIIELKVIQRKQSKATETKVTDEDEDDYQINATAMARVARYTGTEGGSGGGETRQLLLLPGPGQSHALYSMLVTVIHHNDDTHLSLL